MDAARRMQVGASVALIPELPVLATGRAPMVDARRMSLIGDDV